MDINQFGWNDFFEKAFDKKYNTDFIRARVLSSDGNSYQLVTEKGQPVTVRSIPYDIALGDWAVCKMSHGIVEIIDILPRHTVYKHQNQILGSNFDTLFIVNDLTALNLKKIEQDVISAWESGATPVIILTKQDLCEDYLAKVYEAKLIAPGVDVYAVSSHTHFGFEVLKRYLKSGKTIACVGAHCVGKSTLIQQLMNETMDSNEVLMMELDEELYQDEVNYNAIEDLALHCRFHNCQHIHEPGCAVMDALQTGRIDQRNYENYLKDRESIEDDFEHKRKMKDLSRIKRKEQWL